MDCDISGFRDVYSHSHRNSHEDTHRACTHSLLCATQSTRTLILMCCVRCLQVDFGLQNPGEEQRLPGFSNPQTHVFRADLRTCIDCAQSMQ